MKIRSGFEGGSIDVVRADAPGAIELRLRDDAQAAFKHWFYFALDDAAGTPCHITIANAGDVYASGSWEGFSVSASNDGETWFRLPTSFDGERLTFRITPESDSFQLAAYPPYLQERRDALGALARRSTAASTRRLGATLEARDLLLIDAGTRRPGASNIWVIARQHPGEIMAEWFVDGFVRRLLDPGNPTSRRVLENARLLIVPNVNPDGSALGHTRTNSAGVNLNRVWASPSIEKEPEVFLIQKEMEDIGVDLFFDVHGDEGSTLNYLIAAGSWSDAAPTAEEGRILADYVDIDDEIQLDEDYPYAPSGPQQTCGAGLTSIAIGFVADRFASPSFTLEMPFKDNRRKPDPNEGWSSKRSMALGNSLVSVLDRFLGRRTAGIGVLPPEASRPATT